MTKKLIRHINLLGHEINESLQEGYPESDREVYCKRLHAVKEPDEEDCVGCPHFGGLGQGRAHECVWEEPVDISSELERIIPHENRYKEMERVSQMIEMGVVDGPERTGAGNMGRSFRDSASFGKRMEYKIIGDMLMEGLDCYVPLVDDHGVDCVIKKPDGTFIEIQIKATSDSGKKMGDAGLFANIKHEETPNFYFVFYSERMKTTWIIPSADFIKHTKPNMNGKNIGSRTIKLNWYNINPATGEKEEIPNPKFNQYIKNDFSIFK